jgi:hypothetical protein
MIVVLPSICKRLACCGSGFESLQVIRALGNVIFWHVDGLRHILPELRVSWIFENVLSLLECCCIVYSIICMGIIRVSSDVYMMIDYVSGHFIFGCRQLIDPVIDSTGSSYNTQLSSPSRDTLLCKPVVHRRRNNNPPPPTTSTIPLRMAFSLSHTQSKRVGSKFVYFYLKIHI